MQPFFDQNQPIKSHFCNLKTTISVLVGKFPVKISKRKREIDSVSYRSLFFIHCYMLKAYLPDHTPSTKYQAYLWFTVKVYFTDIQ